MEKTIGLMAAMDQESGALLRLVRGWKPLAFGKLHGQSFAAGRVRCILVTSGMGARRARLAAASLVKQHSPHLLISFGIGGAVEASLGIGDVVAAETVSRLEGGRPGSPRPLQPWPVAASEAAGRALMQRAAHWLSGTVITTQGFQVGQEQLGNLLHPVLEMETAGIAEVAAESGVPLLALRSISDGPRAPLPFDLGKIMDEDANLRPISLAREIIRQPGILLRAGRMMRNSATAADNAALALVAALGAMDV